MGVELSFPSNCPLISGYNLYISTNLTELFFKMLKAITNQLRANFMLQYKKEKRGLIYKNGQKTSH